MGKISIVLIALFLIGNGNSESFDFRSDILELGCVQCIGIGAFFFIEVEVLYGYSWCVTEKVHIKRLVSEQGAVFMKFIGLQSCNKNLNTYFRRMGNAELYSSRLKGDFKDILKIWPRESILKVPYYSGFEYRTVIEEGIKLTNCNYALDCKSCQLFKGCIYFEEKDSRGLNGIGFCLNNQQFGAFDQVFDRRFISKDSGIMFTELRQIDYCGLAYSEYQNDNVEVVDPPITVEVTTTQISYVKEEKVKRQDANPEMMESNMTTEKMVISTEIQSSEVTPNGVDITTQAVCEVKECSCPECDSSLFHKELGLTPQELDDIEEAISDFRRKSLRNKINSEHFSTMSRVLEWAIPEKKKIG